MQVKHRKHIFSISAGSHCLSGPSAADIIDTPAIDAVYWEGVSQSISCLIDRFVTIIEREPAVFVTSKGLHRGFKGWRQVYYGVK